MAKSTMKNSSGKALIEIDRTEDRILRSLYYYHYLTAGQVSELLLYSPGSLNFCKAKLKNMVNRGLLQIVHKRKISSKNELTPIQPYHYTFDGAGVSYLLSQGIEYRYFRPGKQGLRSESNLPHLFMVNEFNIALERLTRHDPDVTILERYHDVELHSTLSPFSYQTMDNKTGQKKETKCLYIPDSAFLVSIKTQLREKPFGHPFLLELDLDCEDREVIQRKIHDSWRFFESGAYKAHFGFEKYTLCFATTGGVKRVEQLRTWIQHTLSRTLKLAASLQRYFLVTDLAAIQTPQALFFDPVWQFVIPQCEPRPLFPAKSLGSEEVE